MPRSSPVKELKAALAFNRLPHALCFNGAQDAPRIAAAVELAHAILCQGRSPEGEPCGVCPQCVRCAKGVHPDLIPIRPIEGERTIKIQAVREMIARVHLKPFQASSKVFVIEQADAMTEEAQNALLKTLEEPHPSTYFVLIPSDSAGLLVTVRSRVQSYVFAEQPVRSDVEDPEFEKLSGALAAYATAPSATSWPEFDRVDRAELVALLSAAAETLYARMLQRAVEGAATAIGQRVLILSEARSELIERQFNARLVLWKLKQRLDNDV